MTSTPAAKAPSATAPAHLVLTVIGTDRPGLVDQLAQLVEEHGGNWERSQMARLGGKFAGIVEVSIAADAAAALETALHALGGDEPGGDEPGGGAPGGDEPDGDEPGGGAPGGGTGLHVTVERTRAGPATAGTRLVVSLVGTDRPGLVHAVAAALADAGANIEELATAVTDAPMAGGTLFEATVTVALPAGVTVDDVRTRLEAIADRLMVDIDVEVDRDVDPGTHRQRS